MGYRSVVISSAVHISVKNRQLIISGEATGSIPVEDIRTLRNGQCGTTQKKAHVFPSGQWLGTVVGNYRKAI